MTERQRIGQQAEKQAEEYLRRRGMRPLLRNWSCRLGELDLVCEDDETLVVVEVRNRRNADFGDAVETVDRRKQQRLLRATGALLQARPRWAERPLRFDVVGITGGEITWIRDAFEA